MLQLAVFNSTLIKTIEKFQTENETCQKCTQSKFVKLMRRKEYERAAAGRPDDGVNGRHYKTDYD